MAVDENQFEALDDESLGRFLSEEAARRREHLAIQERAGGWVAETWESGGLSSGRSVMIGATGPDRRTAMLGLAHKLVANRS